MTMEFLAIFFAGTAVGLALCWLRSRMSDFSAQSPHDYDSARQAFDVRKHLNGPMICEGVIYGPTGRVTSRFTADFEGTWDGNRGTLKERFRYDNGEHQVRAWHIEVDKTGKIKTSADDVVGTGKGYQAGNAIGLSYKLRLPEESGGYVLDAIDWMYLLENGTIVNRSQFRKFGFRVAELVATIRPCEPANEWESAA